MQNRFIQADVLISSPKNTTFTISKNYQFNKVAEVLVHLGLRPNSRQLTLEQIINLSKTLHGLQKCALHTRLNQKEWFLSHTKDHLLIQPKEF